MSGNSLGQSFTLTTCGESHGAGLMAIVDGCPPGMPLNEADIQPDLNRRRPGQSKYTTQRREPDEVKIISGVFEGLTTGTPIGLWIKNEDQRSRDYQKIKDQFRPGHADYTYQKKYGIRDYRGGGRSSARETAARVAAGAIAKKYLKLHYDVTIQGYCEQIGDIKIGQFEADYIEQNPFFCPDPETVSKWARLIDQLRVEGSSIGAGLTVVAQKVPIGWGEPVFDRLDADLAKALMSVNAVKAVAIGDGFDVITQRGEQHRDELTPSGFLSNHAGGILGGISSGQEIKASIAIKPTSSIRIGGKSMDATGKIVDVVTTGRHDPCVGVRATPILEAMMALVLMDHAMRHRAQIV